MDLDLFSKHSFRLFRDALPGPENPDDSYVPDVNSYGYAFDGMAVQSLQGRGSGWVASRDIPAGTLLLACKPFGVEGKPLAIVMDSNTYLADENMGAEGDGGDEDGDVDFNVDTGLLILRVGDQLKHSPGLWSQLNDLFPRDGDLSRLAPWRCSDASVNEQVNAALAELSFLSKPQRERLKLIVRFNMLSVESNGEQLCHKTMFARASGVALYVKGSFFNHSDRPNVARYNMGDLAFYRTNQNVTRGTELCICYIESDVLCECAQVRMQYLGTRDFELTDDDEPHGQFGDGAGPIIPPQLMDELGEEQADNRLAMIDDILQDTEYAIRLRPKDVLELNYLKAVSLMQLAKAVPGYDQRYLEDALMCWEKCMDVNIKACPPNDEALVGYAVQAAMSALALGDEAKATRHCLVALRTHELAFGADTFVYRYNDELRTCPLEEFAMDFLAIAAQVAEANGLRMTLPEQL